MPRETVAEFAVERVRVLDADGSVDRSLVPDLADERLVEIYRDMCRARRFDEKAIALQRRGELGTHAPATGQEAAQVASAAALDDEDWVVPAFREAPALLQRGVPMERLLEYAMGLEEGAESDGRTLPPSIAVGSQALHAVGLGWGEAMEGGDRAALTYFGDGATSEGDVLEAINLAGVYDARTVLFCQNNGYAISVPREAQSAAETLAQKAVAGGIRGIQVDGNDPLGVYAVTRTALERARAGEPTLIEALTYRRSMHTTADDPSVYRTAEEEAEWATRDPIDRFEAYLRGEGLLDDERIADVEAEIETELEAAVERARATAEAADPADIFEFAYADLPAGVADHRERRPVGDGGAAAAGTEAGEPATMVEAIRETLRRELARDERVVVYGQDVGVDGGVFRATQGLLEAFPDRVHDFPVAEAGILGSAVGLAVHGRVPVPEIQFSGFVQQGFHQLQQHLARLRARSRGTLSCPVTVRSPYGGGIRALEHHSESFEALYAHTPGLKVAIPSSPAEAAGLLAASVRDPDPVLFLEPMRVYRSNREPLPADPQIPLGEARIARAGEDVTVVAYGAALRDALRAADRVDADPEVIDLRTVAPMDAETVAASVRKTGRCVVVHEAPRTCGIGAEVVARIDEHAFYHLEAPIERVTGYDVPYPLFGREEAYLPGEDDVAAAIERALSA